MVGNPKCCNSVADFEDTCEHCLQDLTTGPTGLRAKCWHRLRMYLKVTWGKLKIQIIGGKMRYSKARKKFYHDFGDDPKHLALGD